MRRGGAARLVLGAVKTLKSGKSSGPDGVLSEHLKYGGPTFIPWLTKVLNRIIVLEEIPPSLKNGLIVPVYKKRKGPLTRFQLQGYHHLSHYL